MSCAKTTGAESIAAINAMQRAVFIGIFGDFEEKSVAPRLTVTVPHESIMGSGGF